MPISVLGMFTIIGYGACYYAYGVLIGPISADTRWPDAALGAIFSATLVITGAGGIVAAGSWTAAARGARAGHHLADPVRRLVQPRLPPADCLAHRAEGRPATRGRDHPDQG